MIKGTRENLKRSVRRFKMKTSSVSKNLRKRKKRTKTQRKPKSPKTMMMIKWPTAKKFSRTSKKMANMFPTLPRLLKERLEFLKECGRKSLSIKSRAKLKSADVPAQEPKPNKTKKQQQMIKPVFSPRGRVQPRIRPTQAPSRRSVKERTDQVI